jgi:hypothetical protein
LQIVGESWLWREAAGKSLSSLADYSCFWINVAGRGDFFVFGSSWRGFLYPTLMASFSSPVLVSVAVAD